MLKAIFSAPLFLLPLTASATTVIGNPNVDLTVVTNKAVYVNKVVAHHCSSGTQTMTVDTVLNQGDVEVLTFDTGEFCDIDLVVRWAPGASLSTIPVDGFTDLKITASSTNTVSIDIDSLTQTADLN